MKRLRWKVSVHAVVLLCAAALAAAFSGTNADAKDTAGQVEVIDVDSEYPGQNPEETSGGNPDGNPEETTVEDPEEKPVVAEGYYVRADDTSLTVTYNGVLQKKVYLALLCTDGNYTVTKPEKTGSRIYYFDETGNGAKYTGTKTISITYEDGSAKYFVKAGKLLNDWYKKENKTYYYANGKMVTGWYKISGKKYYFDKSASNKGVLLTNTIIGTGTEDSYYVDETGVQITDPEIKLAVKFVNAHTKKSWSDSKKLEACFQYLWKNYEYERFYDTPKASAMSDYAVYMLKNKKGNCFRYAASFACIAKVLGYDTRVAVGKISSTHGGMTPHGWTEVKVDGKWYLCDANMQRNYPKINSYMRTNKNYAYRHSCSKRYTLNIKNGKVSWK